MSTVQSGDSPYSISRNNFKNNSAFRGGVLYSQNVNGSSFNITDNTFTYNSARFGGVMYTLGSYGAFHFNI